MAQKSAKIAENCKNHTFFDLWGIGTSEILLKLFIKLRPGLMNVFQPYFSKYLGFGDQKSSKIGQKLPQNCENYGKL